MKIQPSNYHLRHADASVSLETTQKHIARLAKSIVFAGVVLGVASTVFAQQSESDLSARHSTSPGLIADPTINLSRVLPRSTNRRRGPTAKFDIRFNTDNCGETTRWPAQAKTALIHATRLWGNLIFSPVAIKIDACWSESSSANNLASASISRVRNSVGIPFQNTWYANALTDAYSGVDNYPDLAEMTIWFNSALNDWYFGTDMNPTTLQYDFVSVAMHEIGHGLGISDSFWFDDNKGSWGISSNVDTVNYDNFIRNAYDQSLTDTNLFPNPSFELGLELTSNNLGFDGPRVRAANSGSSAAVYAPYSFSGGSSIAHLDEDTFNFTENAMMTPSFSYGEVAHDPGPVGLAVLRDLGWKVAISDSDDDGVEDSLDNCPQKSNPDQRDTDEDRLGDVCDIDMDNDGIVNRFDNCRRIPNLDQRDIDADQIGDACDLDKDGDSVENSVDNCPVRPNPEQQNIDGDDLGDACDADKDGDGHINSLDNCPAVANPDQADGDFDGIGNVCEEVRIGDLDADGIKDEFDNCPVVANPGQRDTDADGTGDACEDADGDGFVDGLDNCPAVANADQADTDNDRIGDACEPGVSATVRQRATATESATVTIVTPAVVTVTAQATVTRTAEATASGATVSRARQAARLQAFQQATLAAKKAARAVARKKAREQAIGQAQ